MVYTVQTIPFPSHVEETRITKDSIINGKRFYYFNNGFPGNHFPEIYRWVTLDSSTGNIMGLSSSPDCRGNIIHLIDSLASNYNDTFKICSNFKMRCSDTSTVNMFGNFSKAKNFTRIGLVSIDYNNRYVQNFGMAYWGTNEVDATIHNLKGCIINGIAYGDTSITYSISGTVKYKDNLANVTSGVVKIIKYNSITGQVTIVHTAQINSLGGYLFPAVLPDTMCIVAYPNSEITPDFVPTYHFSELDWHKATKIFPTANLENIQILVYRITNFTNSSSFNGNVLRQNQSSTFMLNDAIICAKIDNMFKGYKYSNSTGQFSFSNMEAGSYKLYAFKVGFSSDSISFTVSPAGTMNNLSLSLKPEYVMNVNQVSNIIPESFKLYQNYPNPFNPVTKIEFDIPKSSFVKLIIYDVLGREVSVLLNKELIQGKYSYSWNAYNTPSGIYFCRLQTEDYSAIKKMLLIK